MLRIANRSGISAAWSAIAVLLLISIGCKGDTTAPDPDPDPQPTTPVATTLAANSSTSLTGVAGGAVTPAPSVMVKDQKGLAMSGVTVTFSVVSGGGSVSGASATTDASGIATVGSWTLGPLTGPNVLNAASGTLTAVAFTATSTAGAPSSLEKNGGDNQAVPAGTAVPIPPSVIVKDAGGNPIAGISVTFEVVSGGGSITGAAPTTNSAGVATVGSWTLGASGGVNSLSAKVAGLPAVTFTAGAIASVCNLRAAHAFGGGTNGAFSSDDCQLSDGSFVDFYTTSIPQAGAYLFREGAAFDTYLLLAMPDGTTIAENDDADGTNSAIKALLPAGDFLLAPSTFEPGLTGDYSISSTSASNEVENCEQVFIVRNVTTDQNVASTDCNIADGGTPIYADRYLIFLKSGTPVTISMSSAAVDSFLQLVLDGTVVAQNDNVDASTKDSRITFTPLQTRYYAIFARSVPPAAIGGYTLKVQ